MEITTTMIVQDNEIKEFTCFTCQKRFPLISDLTKHLTTEHKPNLLAVTSGFKTEKEKDETICLPNSRGKERNKSPASRSLFFCSICRRGFALKHHVVRHEEKIHGILRPKLRQNAAIPKSEPLRTVVYVPNEVGGMTSHLQPVPQEHSITSTTDLTSLLPTPRQPRPRPHICEVCSKSFTQRHHLKRHSMQAHPPKEEAPADDAESACLAVVPVTLSESNEVVRAKPSKPLHRCSFCCRGFSERHHMIRHEKTVHEAKKDHHCVVCGKLFSQKHHLLNHQIAIHCKTRNFACSFCSKKFSLKHQLQRHEKRVHNTAILADGTVIKKRRPKREIGPDGRRQLTWTGGEVIGFAGPPDGSAGTAGTERTTTTTTTMPTTMPTTTDSGVQVDFKVDLPIEPMDDESFLRRFCNTASEARETTTDSAVVAATTSTSSTASSSSSTPAPPPAPPSTQPGALAAAPPAFVPAAPQPLPAFVVPTASPSADSSPKQLQQQQTAPASPLHSPVPLAVPTIAAPGFVPGTPPPPPQTALLSRQAASATPMLKPQLVPHTIFSAQGTPGFQASPFFPMASNVISALPSMDATVDVNRKWAFPPDATASLSMGANNVNLLSAPPSSHCGLQTLTTTSGGNSATTTTTRTEPQNIFTQSIQLSNAYPLSLSQHHTPPPPPPLQQPPSMQFPPLG